MVLNVGYQMETLIQLIQMFFFEDFHSLSKIKIHQSVSSMLLICISLFLDLYRSDMNT